MKTEIELSDCTSKWDFLRRSIFFLFHGVLWLRLLFVGRERAIQEMRRHGLSTSSLRASPPLSSTLRSPSHSPERSAGKTDQAAAEK